MRIFFLPLFIALLLIRFAVTLLSIITIKLLPHRLFITTVLLFIIASAVFLTSITTESSEPQSLDPKSKIIAQKNHLEDLLHKQPTHRDILLNLAKVNQALDNNQQALNYRTQAFKLDPNYKINPQF